VLDEAVCLDQLLKVVAGDKVVFATVFLAGARAAGRVRDAEAVAVGVLGEEALEEGGLAGARGARDDDWAVVEFWGGQLVFVVCMRGLWPMLYTGGSHGC
jgi:hypothetical protein